MDGQSKVPIGKAAGPLCPATLGPNNNFRIRSSALTEGLVRCPATNSTSTDHPDPKLPKATSTFLVVDFCTTTANLKVSELRRVPLDLGIFHVGRSKSLVRNRSYALWNGPRCVGNALRPNGRLANMRARCTPNSLGLVMPCFYKAPGVPLVSDGHGGTSSDLFE